MTKRAKNSLRRGSDEPARGRKIGERQISLHELAARHEATPDEVRAELGRLRAAGLCDYKNLPSNPYTKFKVETFAPLEPERPRTPEASEFARWVERRFGAKSAGARK